MPRISMIATAQAVTSESLFLGTPAAQLGPASTPDRDPGPLPPAVVIDALRATSTIASALAHGARAVIPVAKVDEARQRKGEGIWIAGERGGDRLPGFDLGNSPVEARAAAGRVLVLTTTNGTLATRRVLEAADGASGPVTILAGAFVNRARVVRALREADAGVVLICAGQEGHPAAEDLLAAGSMVADLPAAWVRDDLSVMAEWAFLGLQKDVLPDGGDRGADLRSALLCAIERCPHGTTLRDKGYGTDLLACADLDSLDILPVLRKVQGDWQFVSGDAGTGRRPRSRTLLS